MSFDILLPGLRAASLAFRAFMRAPAMPSSSDSSLGLSFVDGPTLNEYIYMVSVSTYMPNDNSTHTYTHTAARDQQMIEQ